MEHLEVIQKIGKNNYDLVIVQIKSGLVKQQQVKDIAIKMDMEVNGVFEAKVHQHDLHDVMRYMLDAWWKVKLHKSNDGYVELKQILLEVGLEYLANKMEPNMEPISTNSETPVLEESLVMSNISSDQKQPESTSVQIDPPEGTNTLQNAEQGETEELIEKEKVTKIKTWWTKERFGIIVLSLLSLSLSFVLFYGSQPAQEHQTE